MAASVSAIVIMGVSGSGKSTLGAHLAAATGFCFVEGDDLHPKANVTKMSTGQPLTDADRWPWLEQVVARLEGAPPPGCIVSCSALKRIYRDFIRARVSRPVLFILPETASDVLFHRLVNRADHYMPPSLLESQLATLERPQADEAVVTIDSTRPAQFVMTDLLNLLACRQDIASVPAPSQPE